MTLIPPRKSNYNWEKAIRSKGIAVPILQGVKSIAVGLTELQMMKDSIMWGFR